MKWLILFALIACGHKEPAPVYQDQDGDSIASPLEADSMYIANYHPLPKIEGKLLISGHGDNKQLEASFSNETNLLNEGLKVLSFNKLPLVNEQFFSENSSIRLKHNIREADLASFNFFDVTLITSSDEKFELHLVNEEGEEVVSQKMKSLPRAKLYDLLNGSASLKIVKEDVKTVQQSIQQKTNRVFYYDGTAAKVLYVSKVLTMEQVFDLLKVVNPSEIYSQEWREADHTGWWYRDQGANKSIIFGTNSELREKFLPLLPNVIQTLTRAEGLSQTAINLQVSADDSSKSKIRFRIKKNSRVLRNFSNAKKEISRMGGRGDFTHDCAYNERFISSEYSTVPSTQEILANLVFTVDESEKDLAEIESGIEKTKVADQDYIDIHLEIEGSNLAIAYKPHNQKDVVGFTNAISGDICSEVNHYARSVSTEARWTIEAEVYQEI
jgi:hypothetical protein